MGIAVQTNKKHIIIAAIALLALVSMFVFLKTGKQDHSLINEQNSTMSGKVASTRIQSGQTDSPGMPNSIQGGQTDTLEILTNAPPDSFMNISGEAFVMNNIWNRNSSNNSQGNNSLFNNNQRNLSSQGNSNLLNNNQWNSNLPNYNQANNNLSNGNQWSSNLPNSSQANNNLSNGNQWNSNLPNSSQANNNLSNGNQWNSNSFNNNTGNNNLSNTTSGNNNLLNSSQGNNSLSNSNSGNNNLSNSSQGNNNLSNSNQGNNSFNNSNNSLVINPGYENNGLSLLEEKEIEVAVVTPFIPPPVPSNMGLIPPAPSVPATSGAPTTSSTSATPSNMGLLTGGTFFMGSSVLEEEREEDEGQHHVAVRPFYIGKYEVTQKEYEEVMKKNPSFFVNPDFPVENVSWFDAVEYCNNLSLRDGLPPAYNIIDIGDVRLVSWNRNSLGYRLPTEAEWEYACRAGTVTPFSTGENISRRQANYFSDGPRKVGSYRPNNWGLYDMHGNVSEWCWDWYIEEYAVETAADANYMHLEGHRVFRGGSWFTLTMRLRSAFRDHYFPNYKSMNIGFRVVRNSD
jgi:formylglycine-generating enzyme required for sulfatase activity